MNADDPIACIEAARLAWEYRARFRRDFLIDLVGYRRHGHNEGDEPAFTQPLMYQKIDAHPTVRELFGKTLVEHGLVPESAVVGLEKKHFATLEAAYASLKPEQDFVAPLPEQVPAGVASVTKTGVPLDRLREISDALLAVPPGFTVHKKLERGRDRRRGMLANADERVGGLGRRRRAGRSPPSWPTACRSA